MSKINLTKAWNKSALPYEDPDISPPIVNVFAIDTSGNQMQQRERNNIAAQGGPLNFGSHDGGKADSRSSRKGTDSGFLSEWLQLMSPSYQRSYHQFMETADDAMKFYDEYRDELSDMKAELEEFKAYYDKNTIRLSDGRRVYVDENGGYTYQDAYGNWNKLEDSAVAEAKAKHQILGDQAITNTQKIRLDELEAEVLYEDAATDSDRQQILKYKEAAANGEMSEEEIKESQDDIESRRKEREERRERLEAKRDQISQDVKPDRDLKENELTGSNRNDKVLGGNLRDQSNSQQTLPPAPIG